jgi:hypothetical protein
MGMAAARGLDVAYSWMLEATGLPYPLAHATFEDALDAELTPVPETPQDVRAALRAQMRAAGTDATARALAESGA